MPIPAPKLGADELGSFSERTNSMATVRTEVRTLENSKAAAQPLSEGDD